MHIYKMRIDGSQVTRLTPTGTPFDFHPSWSPDSHQLVYQSDLTGNREIWVMNADGTWP